MENRLIVCFPQITVILLYNYSNVNICFMKFSRIHLHNNSRVILLLGLGTSSSMHYVYVIFENVTNLQTCFIVIRVY